PAALLQNRQTGAGVQLISVNQLVGEASELAARLDALGARDYREITLLALQRAEEEYAALVERRALVTASAADTATLDALLDNLRARLKFFAKRR
ncbi:MAG TPA: hypothetical protein VGS10_01805, partial [Terracidiphilus sp.]|nr:hypothetical protein [Terracidiphilus sp.]